ncbi:MAG: YafY family protein [Candidatus Sericytochromatia bacterium]
MSKSKRLVELIMSVNSKKRFTVQELADEFDVSYRTILRDLGELEEIGIPLYSEVGVGGGYRVLNDRILPPISFTESEAISLFFIAESIKYYNSLPFKNDSSSALKKFYHYLPNEVKETIDHISKRLTFWTPTITLSDTYLKDLLDSSIKQEVVKISYDSENEESEREIQSIGLYTARGIWYCPSYCFKSKCFRLFRVDRVKSFSRENIISEKIDLDNFNISDWFKEYEPENSIDDVEITVKLTRKGVKRLESDMFFSNNIILNDDSSGTLVCSISQSHISWVINYFTGFGLDGIVEKPEFMREEIKNNINNLLKVYS